jgi:hypothetical protein
MHVIRSHLEMLTSGKPSHLIGFLKQLQLDVLTDPRNIRSLAAGASCSTIATNQETAHRHLQLVFPVNSVQRQKWQGFVATRSFCINAKVQSADTDTTSTSIGFRLLVVAFVLGNIAFLGGKSTKIKVHFLYNLMPLYCKHCEYCC